MAVPNALGLASTREALSMAVMSTKIMRLVIDRGEVLPGCDRAKGAETGVRERHTAPAFAGFAVVGGWGPACATVAGLCSLPPPTGPALGALGLAAPSDNRLRS